MPAYGCLVAINTMTASIDRAAPVISRCLFADWPSGTYRLILAVLPVCGNISTSWILSLNMVPLHKLI